MTAPQQPQDVERYGALQAAVAAAAAAYATQFATLFAPAPLSTVEWVKMLALMYPKIAEFRFRSADLAREFYDVERAAFFPELPPVEQWIEPFEFEWFVKDMEPVRKAMVVEKATPSARGQFVFQAVREVQNGGRRQTINAVSTDVEVADFLSGEQPAPEPVVLERTDLPEKPKPVPREVSWMEPRKSKLAYNFRLSNPQPVQAEPEIEYTGPKLVRSSGETRPIQGWARVATGRETCAWCLMLVSRGAVYGSATSAGLRLDDESAKDAILGGTDVSDLMNEWHIGCDCLVVPVFDLNNWSGKAAKDRALELWVEADEEAERFVEENPGRVHKTGKKRGSPYTKNEEIQLALRRRIDRGEISSQEWAVLSEAA